MHMYRMHSTYPQDKKTRASPITSTDKQIESSIFSKPGSQGRDPMGSRAEQIAYYYKKIIIIFVFV